MKGGHEAGAGALFITNRLPRGSARSRPGRRITFDPAWNAPAPAVYFCEAEEGGPCREMGHDHFFQRVREDPCREVFLYVHGFNTSLEQALRQGRRLAEGLAAAGRPRTLVIPLLWPTSDRPGILRDYWDDQRSADASGYAFARALDFFLAWRNSPGNAPGTAPCLKRIHVLAHSMGARVLRESLSAWTRYDGPMGVPRLFGSIFLAAADIVNETLQRGRAGERLCDAGRHVVVYHASDDLALRGSKAPNLRHRIASRRLGHTGPEDWSATPGNVYAFDCDAVNQLYDPPFGHSYFLGGEGPEEPGAVLRHIAEVLASGRVFARDPDRRRGRIFPESSADG